MRYVCLIYENEEERPAPGTPEHERFMQEYFEFTNAVNEAKVFEGGAPLQPVSTATTVRVRDGQTLITDGPFAETREQLGGYYLLDCRDLDEAIRWAARIPDAGNGSVEVRPVMDYEAMGAPEAHTATEGRG